MNKTEPSNSVLSLILYGVVAAFGVALNFIVLIAFVKGRLALKPYSSIYILALQSIIVDVIFVAIHLIYWIPKAINPDFLGERGSYTDSVILRVADSVGTYAWFHNALSHAIIAANRFIVIIYYQRNILTRQRVIAMAVVHHILALTITLLTQFAIPCCRLSFNFSIFSYFNVPNGDMPNYSDIFFTVPVNTIGSVTSLICYSTILLAVRRARRSVSGDSLSKERRTEYSYAIQFASLATVFSFCWLSFRIFPFIIPVSDPSLVWVFGLTTVFTMTNCYMNALVYLLSNKDVREHLPSLCVNRATTFQITSIQTSS